MRLKVVAFILLLCVLTFSVSAMWIGCEFIFVTPVPYFSWVDGVVAFFLAALLTANFYRVWERYERARKRLKKRGYTRQ